MSMDEIQQLCAQGQELLMSQQYVQAEQVLARAEREAFGHEDWDTLARLYMPLQEARRQRRQRCMEGVVCLSLISQGHEDHIIGRHVVENYPHGQLLVAGWGNVEPALQTRKLQIRFSLYLDVFLGAAYPLIEGGHVVVIVPHEQVILPDTNPRHLEDFRRILQPGCVIVREDELPVEPEKGDLAVQERITNWWKALSTPFLTEARETKDLRKRVAAYRKVIRVDYACEFAHQELSATAHELMRACSASHK